MGPQHVRCGMQESVSSQCAKNHVLQWGRNMFVAECCQIGKYASRTGTPSMGPQHVRCGMTSNMVLVWTGDAPLQWGRNMFVAECGSGLFNVLQFKSILQWGRNMFVAE